MVQGICMSHLQFAYGLASVWFIGLGCDPLYVIMLIPYNMSARTASSLFSKKNKTWNRFDLAWFTGACHELEHFILFWVDMVVWFPRQWMVQCHRLSFALIGRICISACAGITTDKVGLMLTRSRRKCVCYSNDVCSVYLLVGNNTRLSFTLRILG